MPTIFDQRMTAQIDGDFVVFLIGLRINTPWKVTKGLPAVRAMPRMLRELDSRPASETGLLGHSQAGLGTIIQYWRSFDHLEAYANARDSAHFPAWVAFNKRMKTCRADVGIWHETYL
ncbi:MAG: monooxygenase family protein, partial [Rhodobacterales bacterium]